MGRDHFFWLYIIPSLLSYSYENEESLVIFHLEMEAGSTLFNLKMILVVIFSFFFTNLRMCLGDMNELGEQPLSKIAIHKTILALHSSASITASPFLLGNKV
jgi:hypothetical protein